MAILTRKQKELLVIDLYYNQNKNYREITKQVRMYPREIKKILEKASAENESGHTLSKQAQAYKMFDEDKTPTQIAIALDLPEPEVTKFYKESLNLKQLGELNRIYLETEGNLAPFLNLYRMAKTAGYRVEHVIWLLGVANKGLTELERRYDNLKSEVDWLEVKRQNLLKLIQKYDEEKIALGKSLDDYLVRCEQQGKKLADLQAKRIKEENITRHFQNNNAEITKIAEEKVRTLLLNNRAFLNLATICILESIMGNPKKYSHLIHQNEYTAMDYTIQDFNPSWMLGQPYLQSQYQHQQHKQSKVYFFEDYLAMISDDANKLLEKLAKVLSEEVINNYPEDKPSSLSLPAFLPTSRDFSSNEEARKGSDTE